ncbi:hypothetical protein ACFX13_007318 [Malus domestica]
MAERTATKTVASESQESQSGVVPNYHCELDWNPEPSGPSSHPFKFLERAVLSSSICKNEPIKCWQVYDL